MRRFTVRGGILGRAMPRNPEPRTTPLARWRAAAAERSSVSLRSDFRHPPLRLSAADLAQRFEGADPAPAPLRNPHHEAKVGEEERRRATPAAVLIPVVAHEREPTLLVTERHESISYAGHICFPGGRREESDESDLANALRETEEEIGLSPELVRVLGRLGDYVTHSGFRIVPFVGMVEPPVALEPRAGEVEAILEIPLSTVLRSDSYELRGWEGSERAHFVVSYADTLVTGPTVSIMMGFYEALLEMNEER